MKKTTIILRIVAACILFFIDIACFTIAQKHIVHSLLALYIIELLRPSSWITVSIIVLFLSCESLIYYGNFLYSLLYLILFGMMLSIIRKTCYLRSWYRYVLLILCMIGQAVIVEHMALSLPIPITYTLSKISATLLILTLLTWLGFN